MSKERLVESYQDKDKKFRWHAGFKGKYKFDIKLSGSEEARKFTFFGLAQEAGFNSKTTFNKSFRKLMGASPSEYFSNQSS